MPCVFSSRYSQDAHLAHARSMAFKPEGFLNSINPIVFLKYQEILILPMCSFFNDHKENIDLVVDPVLLIVSSCACKNKG